ncbi:unnamed protein product [Aphanomyces euteiches]
MMGSRLGLRERLDQSRSRLHGDGKESPSRMPPLHGDVNLALSALTINQEEELKAPDHEENDMEDDESLAMDGEDEEEEDEVDIAPEIQQQSMKIMHSRYPNRPPVVCFDYPSDLNVKRSYPDGVVVQDVDMRVSIFFKCYWERNCIKNAFYRAGLVRIKKGKKWTAAWVKHMSREKFRTLQPHQRVNHFPDPWVIGRKDRLMKTLVAMKRKFSAAYSFFPEGYLLPTQKDALLRCLDREVVESLWIVKPPASACGRGIKVVSSSQVESWIKKTRPFIVQRYLASPYLINGFKFDLRLYVLVTSFDPLRVYWFQEGLARFCTVKYSTTQLKNRLAHLTNFSVNKKNDSFKASTTMHDTDGSKWSWTALMAYLAEQNQDVAALRAKMKAIVVKTIIAAEAHIAPLTQTFVKHRHTCYELFGFDLMVDSALEPWLVEVNVSPSLMGGSPLDKRIKGLLMSDIFHLVGHPFIALPVVNGKAASTPSKKPKSFSSRKLAEILHDPNIQALEPAHVDLFTDDDWDIVHSMDDEADRMGHFERLYPTPDATDYAAFFACPRYANRLCEKWMRMTKKAKAKVSQNAAR